MLRDVVGHSESRKQERYDARKQLIAGTTFGWAHAQLCQIADHQIADQLMGFVTDRHGISDPR
jgi:hypothetical protein